MAVGSYGAVELPPAPKARAASRCVHMHDTIHACLFMPINRVSLARVRSLYRGAAREEERTVEQGIGGCQLPGNKWKDCSRT